MSTDSARCDLHVHSRYSTDSGNFALRRAQLGESYTYPERILRVSRERDMRFVTISDHNTLDGALRIAHHPDTFLSVEVTTRFPEDDVPLHVLVWNLTEEDHRDLQPLRPSVVELVAFLRERQLVHALAHPLYRMGPPLTRQHVERMMLLFSIWETRNGARPKEANELAARLAAGATAESIARLADRHGIDPAHDGRIATTGGSDDHGAFDIATTWTEAKGGTPEEFLASVGSCGSVPGGEHGTTVKLAHAVASLAVHAYREAGGELDSRLAEQISILFDQDSEDATQRHAEIRGASVHLVRLLGERGRRGGIGLRELDLLGTRLAALAAAAALQVPYLATARHHAGSRSGLDEIDEAFFGPREETREIRSLVFTDTYDEANGVAGTMRRLAAEGAAGALPIRVATAQAHAAEEPHLITFPPDWTLPLPTYEQLELRFPLITDVLERTEAEQPTVIHVATPGPVGLCGLVAAKLLELPVVGSYHTELGPYALHLTRDLLVAEAIDLWVDWFYRQCDMVLAPTTHLADSLSTRGDYDVSVWGRGVDTQLFRPERRTDGERQRLLGDGSLLLLSVGRVSREKRPEVLLEAFARVHARASGLRLVIVGDGPARAELEASAPAGVTFLGEVRAEALADIYACADVFCFPSTTDTFGQVLLEAAASGLPSVAAGAGGAVELVADGVTGLLAPPGDIDAFAQALQLLVDDTLLRRRLAQQALAQTRGRTWSAAHAQLLDAYASALNGSTVRRPTRIAA
jgi:glycosyltransferase involved in cell wall biosynthesis/predicted metal-dependent phosphoesterase TrpH